MTTAPQSEGATRRIRSALDGLGLDLVVACVGAAFAFAVLPGGSDATVLRVAVGLPLVLVLPGYALVSALFPGRPAESDQRSANQVTYSPGTAERFGLAFVFSLAILPLLAVGHGLLGVPFDPSTALGSVTGTVVALSVVALVRRWSKPPADRYDPPSVASAAARTRDWLDAGRRTDTVLSVVLALTVLLALGSFAYGLSSPGRGASYTSASLVTERGNELVASNYPTNFSANESRSLALQVENHYDEAATYTAVAELQRVQRSGNGSLAVVERERLASFSQRIPANETWTNTHSIRPTMTGTDLRLTYYVYRGEDVATGDPARADRTTHLWVTVR